MHPRSLAGLNQYPSQKGPERRLKAMIVLQFACHGTVAAGEEVATLSVVQTAWPSCRSNQMSEVAYRLHERQLGCTLMQNLLHAHDPPSGTITPLRVPLPSGTGA